MGGRRWSPSRKCLRDSPIFRGPDIGTEGLPIALTRDADCNDGRLADDAPVDAHRVVRGHRPRDSAARRLEGVAESR